ncbi:acyl-CoA dehydrogenase family protein [Streptomyces sp. SL13]|uniref:Acyl-CoA dehydrogenase family protein n=1 Tax=Streptantibioticus silvisoli TaxID=2705255 RepID=A0AA90H2M2_9ACTN|nr:acyl-CoA dehydrogenase family protein [Streptantibioticus silvisoli]MDI5964584.1 acyl-CoA dehydrogenase family protein [Streptantibioticus silvisoli]MDI5970911.1 acyl-CoA dehydrogenase family protein [Streptantibioticus silvisoli]
MIRWSEEQQELCRAIGEVAAKLGSDHLENDKNGTFDQEGWQKLKDVGLFGLPFDTRHGGLGKDLTTTVHVLEQLGYAGRDSGLNFSVSTHMVSTGVPLQRFGSSALKERYLPEICAGTMIGAHAITEPSGGSDVMGMLTTAVADGDDFVLNGSKAFVSNGSIADLIVVYARTGAPGDVAGITVFLVRRDSPGLSVGNPISKMGLRTSPLAEVFLDNVRVPRDHVIGAKGAGFLILDHVMKWEILCGFGIIVGEMRRRLERCVEYARTRTAFGSAIGSNQSVANMIVEMRIDVDTAQKWIHDTAEKLQSKADVASDIAITKLVVSEANVRSALAAVQVFGGYGYVSEYGVEKDLRDAVGGRIYSGTSEVQRQRLATLMGLNRPVKLS